MPTPQTPPAVEVALPEGFTFLGDVQTMTYTPGDVLVVSTDQRMSADQAMQLRVYIKRTCPDCRVLILDGGLRIGVLAREAVDGTN